MQLFTCDTGDVFQLYGNRSIRLIFKFHKITGIHIIHRNNDFDSLVCFYLLYLVRACRLHIFHLNRLFNALLAQFFAKIITGKRLLCKQQLCYLLNFNRCLLLNILLDDAFHFRNDLHLIQIVFIADFLCDFRQ